MKYNKVGKSDLCISEVSFGCWELGGGKWQKKSDENNIELIRYARKLEINIFDTAVNYGDGYSEEIVGKALKGIRNQCIIATKVRPESLKPEDVRKSFENSLHRLQTDYIDILYIHWPNDDIPLKDTMSEFNKLKEEKLIRAIGVSNFSIDQLREASEYAQVDIVQLEYSLLMRKLEDEILPFCRENSISITSYSSLAKGLLTGAYHLYGAELKPDDFRSKRRLFTPEHREHIKDLINLLKEIAESKDATLSEIAISWILHQKGMISAIVGTQSKEHFQSNLNAINISLSPDELDALDKTSRAVLKKIDA